VSLFRRGHGLRNAFIRITRLETSANASRTIRFFLGAIIDFWRPAVMMILAARHHDAAQDRPQNAPVMDNPTEAKAVPEHGQRRPA
jgi:hypothetical protein